MEKTDEEIEWPELEMICDDTLGEIDGLMWLISIIMIIFFLVVI
jgi:hypothetical protein